MTPTDEATFIALWTAGLDSAAIGRRLGIPKGTVGSRAHRLQQRGLIQPRPKGGAYPRQRALARPDQPPVHRSVQSHAPVQSHTPVQSGAEDGAELPIPAVLTEELGRLWAAIEALRQDVHRPVHTTVQSLPEPLFDNPTDNATERWNLYVKHGLRVRIEALALARGIAPSRVVQELLWTALTDR